MRKLQLILLLFLFATTSNAQDWYTQYKVTQTVSTSENMSGMDFLLTYPGFTFSAGNNFNRVLGARISAGIFPQSGHAGKVLEKTFPDIYNRYRFYMAGGYGDLTVNLTELFSERDPSRTDGIYFLAGGGAVYTFGFDKKVNSAEWAKYYPVNTKSNVYPVVHFGFGGLFKLTKALDLTVEAKYNFVSDKYNGVDRGAFTDGYFDLGVGVSWYFSRRHLQRSEYPYIPDDLDQSEKFRPGELMNTGISFYFEFERVPTEQYVYAKNVADFLKAKPYASVIIHGYPDKNYKDVERQEKNKELAKQRAEAVRDLLIKRYAIAPNRLSTTFHPTPKGGYKQNGNLHRAVEFEMTNTSFR